MSSLKQSKSRSFSKGIGKLDLQASTYMQKTLSTQTKEQPKRINSISIVSKNTPSKQLHRQNKQNTNLDKQLGSISNSEYIKSLYKKYLGKENEVEKGERTMKMTESQSAFKQMKESTTLFGNTGAGISKINSYRESGTKINHPIRSTSKKDLIGNLGKERKTEVSQELQLMEMCDMEDSVIRSFMTLRQARKKHNKINY